MKLLFLFLLLFHCCISQAQMPSDSLNDNQSEAAADDPSQFFTRVEVFNELQCYHDNIYMNFTTLRTIIRFAKRFTTRLDVPLVYNSSVSPAGYRQCGLGDISFRLLGYKFFQSRKSAITASIECSLNTAQSPLLGSGKYILIPMVSYTTTLNEKRVILAFAFQQANSFAGDKSRETVSFSKLQTILINIWSGKVWTVLAPEWYLDYIHGGLSMNLEGKVACLPAKRINLWAQTGVGVFGDFIARYQWSVEVGCRYFFQSNPN